MKQFPDQLDLKMGFMMKQLCNTKRSEHETRGKLGVLVHCIVTHNRLIEIQIIELIEIFCIIVVTEKTQPVHFECLSRA
jgi:hypothetical protein